MYKKIYRLVFTLIGLLTCLPDWAQQQDSIATQRPEMAEAMRSNGKIYVVIAVLVTILLGLILYVARLDRKISKLEKEA
jgi:hypothetical protein